MEDLNELRKQLDRLDAQLVDTLEKRFAVTDKVAAYKNAHNLPVLARERELEVIDRASKLANHPALRECLPDVLERIFEANKTARIFNLQKELSFKKIGIIGLGLIGGSIVKALKIKDPQIVIHALHRDFSQDLIDAHSSNVIDYVENSIPDLLDKVDLVILAAPIDKNAEYVEKIIQPASRKHLVVIDVASVKSEIAKIFEKQTNDSVEFVATHPMAGSHLSGFRNARPQLFVNRPWVLSPHAKNSEESILKISQFISYLGANPIKLEAELHDQYVATVSHLVFIVSTYLFLFASEITPESLQVAGSGFSTTTRLASGNVNMHDQIVKHNFSNISRQLEAFILFLKKHPLSLDNSFEFFSKAKAERDIFAKKNIV